MKENELAEAIREVFISPNVPDSDLELAIVVDALDRIARSIHYLAESIQGNKVDERIPKE